PPPPAAGPSPPPPRPPNFGLSFSGPAPTVWPVRGAVPPQEGGGTGRPTRDPSPPARGDPVEEGTPPPPRRPAGVSVRFRKSLPPRGAGEAPAAANPQPCPPEQGCPPWPRTACRFSCAPGCSSPCRSSPSCPRRPPP